MLSSKLFFFAVIYCILSSESCYKENPNDHPINSYSFGKFTINCEDHSRSQGVGSDVRIVNGKVSHWKERKGHLLKKNMITGIYEENIEFLVIGNGYYGYLECPKEVIEEIKKRIPEVIIEKTAVACNKFNELFQEGKKVAFLAHGTC